ncbi:MAG: hypothetical protein LBR16_01705 [Treponema sp.]|jgi:hypothetical protein|nr:hypothetical protein [Treponema sp.]
MKQFLISCGKQKCGKKVKAADMYTSPRFKMALAYARKQTKGDDSRIFVLSAKHGLLSLDKVIEPYDETLNTKKAAERRDWAQKVLAQLAKVTNTEKDVFIFLTGKKYNEYLLPALKYELSLQGKNQGKTMQWLKEQLAAGA